MFISLVRTFWYIDMPDVTANYGTLFWFYCVFWVFSYIFYDYSCLNCWISTRLSLIVCLINTNMSKCKKRLQAMECLLISLRVCIFWTKLTNIHAWSALPSPNIPKLCIWCEYKHFDIIKYQMWLQVMERSLILLRLFHF